MRITRAGIAGLLLVLGGCGPTPAPAPSAATPLATITFPDRGGLVFLAASAGGTATGLWLLDSGFETSVITPRTIDAVHAPLRAGTKADDQAWTGRLCLAVTTLELCADSLARIPLDGLEPLIADRLPGIFGHDVFQHYAIRIDYANRTVSFYAPETYRAPSSAVAVPVLLENGEPFLVGMLHNAGRTTPAKLKIDTGSLDFMGLNGSFVAQTGLVPASQARRPAPGANVHGATENWITRIDSVTIDGLPTLLHPPVGYSASLERSGDAGTLGARLLSRFIVTFDYAHHRVWFEAKAQPSTPIGADASGAILGAPDSSRHTRVVVAVADSGPAHRAGLQVGDAILAIDGAPASAVDLFSMRRLFERADTTYRLTVRRGTTDRDVELHTTGWP